MASLLRGAVAWQNKPRICSDVELHFVIRGSDWNEALVPDFCTPGLIDTAESRANNAAMVRPEAVRRVKSYSAATGYVYQYYFYEVQKSRRGFSAGTEYVYRVSLDRHNVFPLRVFVRREALEKWGKKTGREMTPTEEYAVAKMRLFRAFEIGRAHV